MQLLILACAAACLISLDASAAVAQDAGQPANGQDYQYAPGQFGPNPNVRADQAYQASTRAYDQARAENARQRGAYDRQAAEYRARQEAYRAQMNSYKRARADYDRKYGPGAYADYRARPVPPPSPY